MSDKTCTASVFVVALHGLLLEGLHLDDAVDEALCRAGWPEEHGDCVETEIDLRLRREQLEHRHAKEWAKLHGAIRFGGSTVEVAKARARVNIITEKLLNL